MQKLPTPEDKHEEKAIADIEKHGVHVLNVFDPDGNDPKFNYSVGLWHSYEHPEILIFGLDAEISTQLINDIADKCRADDPKPTHGSISSDYVSNFDVQFLRVPKSQYKEHFGWARWLYKGDDFPVLQMVFPDKFGNWPWSDEVSEDFKWFQPVLGHVE